MHVLNALEENASINHDLSAATFSLIGANGIASGRSGVFVRAGQLQFSPGSPHFRACEVWAGNGLSTTPRSSNADFDRKIPCILLVMYTICLEILSFSRNLTNTAHNIFKLSFVMPTILCLHGIRYSLGHFI